MGVSIAAVVLLISFFNDAFQNVLCYVHDVARCPVLRFLHGIILVA